jgi:hypothetical protein
MHQVQQNNRPKIGTPCRRGINVRKNRLQPMDLKAPLQGASLSKRLPTIPTRAAAQKKRHPM